MNETQKNIRAYKRALPELKERVIAVALLLLMSAAMMTSATFAWITLSRAPEVSDVTTTVAANGNLEIALATGEGTESPGESKVGDSSAAEGQSIVSSNITWGNLINLSDPAYGLEKLTLRPAQLNHTALLTSPLYSTSYGKDGRVEKLTSNFAYTSWVPPEGNVEGYFGLAEGLGVRAISSTKLEAVGFLAEYLALEETANAANILAGSQYTAITENDSYMSILGKLMGIHMTAKLNSEDKYINAEISSPDLNAFISMYQAFIDSYEQEAEAIAGTLNLQLFLAYGGDTSKYTAYTAPAVLNATANSGNDFVVEASIENKDGSTTVKQVKIINFKTFINDYKLLLQDMVKLQAIADKGDLRWTASGLKDIVNRMVNIDECTIAKKGGEPKTVKALLAEFSSDIGAATDYMGADVDAVITNGVLKNFAQRVGVTIDVGPLPITAKMYVSRLSYEAEAQVKAKVTTSAASPYEFPQDLLYAKSLNTGADDSTAIVTAEDTYALAVDFWVRTNASNTYLTLEGNLLTKEEEEDATVVDPNGNTAQLYTLSRTENFEAEDGQTTTFTDTYDLYQMTVKAEDGTEVTQWYDAANHSVFELEEGETPTLKKVTIITVIGYEGENRVWDAANGQFLSTDSTTQGSGSCYVYYADNPEDQARSLKLLEAFNVAFIDSKGALLANAIMDTENFYAENGRVIVPLVLDDSAIDLGEDFEGNTTLAITSLNQNEPMRITALVYLDGTKLSNQNVLAASDIQGQLNIQFGSSAELKPIENEELYQEVRRVSASVDVTSFDYDTHKGDMTTNVTVMVDGAQPATVSAFFVRAINATQGSRENTMTFTKTDGGKWTSSYSFTAPGTYILRTVMLDGVEYPLAETPTVIIEGFAVESLSCDEAVDNHVNVITADPSTTINMKLKFAADDVSKMPSSVQGRFLNDEDGSAINVNFKLDAKTQMWTGTATFQKSGNYTMQYLVLDGEYAALNEAFHHTAAVKLGMRVAVYTTSPVSFKFLPSEMTEKQKLLGMQVMILDNAGNELRGLTGAKLVYRLERSAATLDTDLTWNGSFYVGELRAEESGGPGTWVFSNVSVGGNNLTTATISPTFRMAAPEPPSYAGITNKANYQFVPNGSGKMEANIKYSATATVVAVIADSKGVEHEVQGTLATTNADNISTWYFQIPKVNNTQDGRWTMKELRVWNFYKANGDYVSAEIDSNGILVPDGERDEPLVFDDDVKDENYTTKAVQTVNLRIGNNEGNADREFSGPFLQTHTLSGVNFDLYDYENQKLPNVTNAQLVYNYDGNTSLGGYTSASVSATDGYFTLNFAADNAGIHFVQSGSQTVQYAGNYTPAKLSVTVNGQISEYVDAKILEMFPAIKITSTTPTVSIVGRTNHAGSSTNGNTITVVFGHSTESACGITYHNYQHTSVTLGLAGMGAASSATLNFAESSGATVHLYTEVDRNGKAQNRVDGYTWAADGDCLRWVGYLNQTTGNDDITPAGTITATKLVLTHNNVEYEVDIDDITIINKTP